MVTCGVAVIVLLACQLPIQRPIKHGLAFVLYYPLTLVILSHRMFETIQVAKIIHFKNKQKTKRVWPSEVTRFGKRLGSFGQLLWRL